MQLQYDEDFVEGAVFVLASRRAHPPAPLQLRRFHAGRERLYSITDPEERNAAFFSWHLEWFREWGLEKALLALVDEFPRMRTGLSVLVFRKARARNDEGAELYVSAEQGRAAVAALRVERFNQPLELSCFLRHEFFHVDDMLSPAFGYSPQLNLAGRNAAQQRLARERYRLLWDITIDGRLTLSGHIPLNSREQHRAAFESAFAFWPADKRESVFTSLWCSRDARHQELESIAADPRGLQSALQPSPGAPCPLCGFATFVWADLASLDERILDAIHEEFPSWTAVQGACGRCIEVYRRVPHPGGEGKTSSSLLVSRPAPVGQSITPCSP